MKSFKSSRKFCRVLFSTCVGLLFISFSLVAQEDTNDVIELDKFIVTGSRIPRLDVNSINPVIRISQSSLESAGFTTVGDSLRSLSFNNGFALTGEDSGQAFSPGISSFNLRDLGNNNTLVLINGRRAAPNASPSFNGFQAVFDLNSLPSAAIESIEILKDGGSAIYGSDAVAGVVNVKLRDDFEGLNVVLEVGNYFDTDALRRKASINVGSVNEGMSIYSSFSWEKREAVFNRDLDYSADADQTARSSAEDVTQGWSATGFQDAGFATEEEYIAAIVGGAAPVDFGLWDNTSSRGFPGYLTMANGTRVTYNEPTDNPTLANSIDGVNNYNFQARSGLFPELERVSFFTGVTHELTNWLSVFAEVSITRTESTVTSAPATMDIENSRGINFGDPMILPDYNPFNPTGEDIFNGRRRFVDGPDRVTEIDSDTPRLVLGFRGDIASIDDWEWEFGMMYSKNKIDSNRLVASDSRLQMALNGLTEGSEGDLSWNPNTPISDRVYFNWFGENDARFANFIMVNNPTVAEFEIYGYDFSASGSLMELPAGKVELAVGAEYRKENFKNVLTQLNLEGDILGGSEGSSTAGRRDLTALYAELIIPVMDRVEIQLAARYEDYSDEGFKDEARPKVGVKITPVDGVTLRASYSESFKAPDLAYISDGFTRTFSPDQVNDPVTGNEIDQLEILTNGVPTLEPELSDTYYAGLFFEPGEKLFGGALDGVFASVEYFRFDRSNLLARLSDIFTYQEFLEGENAGDELFAGRVVRDSMNNVLHVIDDYSNISEADYRGWDFRLGYGFNTENSGYFYFEWNGTYIHSTEFGGIELVGGYLNPRWRQNFSGNWTYGDWKINTYLEYIDSRSREIELGTIFGQGDVLSATYVVDRQIVVNTNVTYSGFKNTNITLGVNNLFNSEPPVDPGIKLGATAGVNRLKPAFWYIRLERSF